MDSRSTSAKIAVVIPCYNEALTIAEVVSGFRQALPDATVYVFDNNSTDETAARAAEAGAVVRAESRQGKGNAVRRMFADVEAEVYVMVDGDGTYSAPAAPLLVDTLLDGHLDMVVAVREPDQEGRAYRPGHALGNRALTAILGVIFGRQFNDILSGYRALSRRFVKSFPPLSTGFEIETEIAVHALALRMPVGEVNTPYFERPEGATSKLRTYRDGFRILLTMIRLFRTERPLRFFSILAACLALVSIFLSLPIFVTYLETGLVPRLPTAILSASLMIVAFGSQACGLILDTVSRGRREAKFLHYISLAPPGRDEA